MSCANRFCVNLVAHRRQTGTQSGSLTKMAGFPCSGFFVFYLTAITILQVAAAMSVERASTIPLATMPGPNVSFAGAKPPRINPSENGKLEGEGQVESGQSCPNCENNNEKDAYSGESDIYKLRIEMVKAKILAKLSMDKPPVLKHKAKDSRIAALLENLNLLEENKEGSESEESDQDKYYGKATKIIVFSERAKAPPSRSRRQFSKSLVLQFKLKQKQLSSSVPFAFLWLHKRKHKGFVLNGKTLHLETHDVKSHKGISEIPVSGVMTTKVKEEKNGSEWVVADVKDIVQLWFNKTAQQYESSNASDSAIYTIEISCLDCESEAGHLISSRGRLRPFLVIDLDKPRTLNRKKRRALTCKGRAVECCRQELYVDFTRIGWDWIAMPRGFYANFCDGECRARSPPFHNYHYVLQQMNQPEVMKVCCAPSKMLGLSIVYFNSDHDLVKTDLPDMRIDECTCMYG